MANEIKSGFLREAQGDQSLGPLVVSGTLTDTSGNTLLGALTETAPATDTASSGLNGRLQRIAQRITSLIALLPTSLGQKTMANSLAVAIASDQSSLPIPKNTTATLTNVNDTASSTTILASNASRCGATIANDSTSVLYLKFGATASTTSFTVALPGSTANGISYYEVPFGYTGIIDGIWSSDSSGAARVTEITA